MKPSILLVDDEKKMLDILQINLSAAYKVYVAENGMEAQQIIKSYPLDMIISDLKMPKMDGRELFAWVKKEFPSLPFIIMTAFGTVEDAVEAMKSGAFDYIVKPIKLDVLKQTIEKTLHFQALVSENKKLKDKLIRVEEYRKIVTADPQMNKILNFAKQAARSDANVLITGESGTGKQLMAEYIHNMSNVSGGPFVEINAGAIPHELLESELFGHEKGAFTGAVKSKPGKFELANNGTLFLDEIGELPIDLQVKLLHVVEQNKITRVGGTKEIITKVRLITATNRNLLEEVENKKFRSDLYYRLRVISISLPSLKQRKADIPLLAKMFVKKHYQNGSEQIPVFSSEALDVLMNYSWPGNIRELENIVQQALIFAVDGKITKENLPPELLNGNSKFPLTKGAFQRIKQEKTDKIIANLEIQFLTNLLNKSGGNVTKAAEISGYNRRQLQNLLAKYHFNLQNFKL